MHPSQRHSMSHGRSLFTGHNPEERNRETDSSMTPGHHAKGRAATAAALSANDKANGRATPIDAQTLALVRYRNRDPGSIPSSARPPIGYHSGPIVTV